MGKTLALVLLLTGCGNVALKAELEAPAKLVFQPGVGDDSFVLFQDGPDDDTGVFDTYVHGIDDATATKLVYRRENKATGGRIYMAVIANGERCEADIKQPEGDFLAFDNACGRGSMNLVIH